MSASPGPRRWFIEFTNAYQRSPQTAFDPEAVTAYVESCWRGSISPNDSDGTGKCFSRQAWAFYRRRSLCCSAPHTSSPSSALTPPPSFTRLRFPLSGCVPPLTGRRRSWQGGRLHWRLCLDLAATRHRPRRNERHRCRCRRLGRHRDFHYLAEPKGQSLEAIAETPGCHRRRRPGDRRKPGQ